MCRLISVFDDSTCQFVPFAEHRFKRYSQVNAIASQQKFPFVYYNPFLVYCRELAPGTVSLTGDRAQGDDSKHDSHYTSSKLICKFNREKNQPLPLLHSECKKKLHGVLTTLRAAILLNSAFWVILHALLSAANIFEINFSKISFKNTVSESNSLDPDQD